MNVERNDKKKNRKTNTHNELNQFNGVKFPEHECTKWYGCKHTQICTMSLVLGRNKMQIFKKKEKRKKEKK